MKKYMKIICLLLTAVLISAFLGGCNGSDLKKLNLDSGTKTKKLSPGSITICFPGYEPSNLNNINEMLVELNKKTNKEFSTTIELQWLPCTIIDYNTELIKLLESGSGPDAFWTLQVAQLREKGLIKDITNLFPEYAPKYYSLLKKSWGNEAKDCGIEFKNKLYAVLNNDLRLPQSFVIVRKDMAEKYAPHGIPTFEEYGKFMKAVKDNEKDMVPGNVGLYDFLNTYLEGNGYFSQFSVGLYNSWNAKDLVPIPAEEISEFRTACGLYKQWYENKFLLDRNGAESREKWLSGKVASILVNGSSLHSTYYNSYLVNTEYSVYPLYPRQPYLKTRPGYSIGINERSSKADRVLMFIEWLQGSQENYDLFMCGIKDNNYKLKGNKLDFTGLSLTTNVIAQWSYSNVFKNYIYERPFQYEPENYKEFQEKYFFNNTMTINKVYEKFGYETEKFNSLTDDEKTELNRKYEQTKEYFTKRNNICSKFIEQWEAGNFTKTLDTFMNEEDGKNSTKKLLEYISVEMKVLKK